MSAALAWLSLQTPPVPCPAQPEPTSTHGRDVRFGLIDRIVPLMFPLLLLPLTPHDAHFVRLPPAPCPPRLNPRFALTAPRFVPNHEDCDGSTPVGSPGPHCSWSAK